MFGGSKWCQLTRACSVINKDHCQIVPLCIHCLGIHRYGFVVVQARKADGYAIIGVEQTSGSVSLPEFAFEQRTVLLLGNEMTGTDQPFVTGPFLFMHLLATRHGCETDEWVCRHSGGPSACDGHLCGDTTARYTLVPERTRFWCDLSVRVHEAT